MRRIRAEVAIPSSEERDRPIAHTKLRSVLGEMRGAPHSILPIPSPSDPNAPADITLTIPDEDSDPKLLHYQPADGGPNLETLLNYDDREFIQAAYSTLMMRAPDSGGLDTYLRLLRSGVSKLEILRILRDSAEGRDAAVRVAGLPRRLLLAKLCRWPLIGSLVRLLTALWNLPQMEYRQRVLDGRLFSLMDQASTRAKTSYAVIKRALKDLETANRQLVEYAAAKPGYDDIRRSNDAVWLALDALQRNKTDVEQISQLKTQLGETANALHTLQSVKADRSSVDETRELLARALTTKVERQEIAVLTHHLLTKAEVVDVAQLQTKLVEISRALDALQSVKADHSSVDETRELLARALATKVEREEIAALTHHLLTKAEVVDVARLQTKLVETSRALDALQSVKADQSSVDETRHLLALALATKAERHEITALTNHLVGLVQARLKREDLEPIEVSCAQIIRQAASDRSTFEVTTERLTAALGAVHNDAADRLQLLMQLRAHYDAIEASHTQVKETTEAALNGLSETLLSLSQDKADRTALDATQTEMRISLESVRAETEKRLGAVALSLNDKIEVLDQSKISRDAAHSSISEAEVRTEGAWSSRLDAVVHSLNAKIEVLDQTKINCDAAYASISEAKARTEGAWSRLLDAAVHSFNAKIEVLDQSKINRDAVYASISEADVRTEGAWSRRLDAAVHSLNAKLEVLDQSKINRDAAYASVTDAEARIGAALNSLNEILQAIAQGKADRVAFEATQADMRTAIDGLRTETDHRLNEAVNGLNGKLDSLAQLKIDRNVLQAESRTSLEEARRQAQEALHLALAPIEARTSDIKRNLLDQERRLGLFLEEARKRLPKPLSTSQIANLVAEDDHLLDAMYASFEDMFRGTREDIKDRGRIYLPYIRAAKVDLSSAPVIDLGCGRGEWLELLRDEEIISHGVDINRVFLEACRATTLDVKESDAVTFLRKLKPSSVAVVTSFHLIEHLPLKTVIALLDESLRVLKPGGLIILETPNPENLEVGGCNFYTDPTHRNPLPPLLTQALVELRGFVRPVIVRRDQEKIRLHVPPLISVDQPIARSINPIVELMRDHFYVSPDYAVVATKA
jgi:O-antigen chain-terminating methyltransferase